MATPLPSTSLSPRTGDPIVDAMTSGFSWQLDGDRVIDWSISGGFEGEFWISQAAVRLQVEAALASISDFVNVRFNYVGAFATPAFAYSAGSEVNVGISREARFFESDDVLAVGVYPRADADSIYLGAAGDVFLNVNSGSTTLPSYAPGSEGFFVLLHELGHALGLKHPFDDGGSGRPTVDELGIPELDIDWATMMAYGDDYDFELRAYDPATPMVLDVLALRRLYGANPSTNAGDDTHLLRALGRYNTVWDARGRDEVSAAGSIRGWYIYMPDEAYSTQDPVRIGFAAPLDEFDLDSPESLTWLMGDMENARGSDNADEIYGNVLDNVIHGGGGHDYIDGWTGSDSIAAGAGDDTVYGDEGDDSISGGDGANFLRGEDGADVIVGGAGADDIHGNMGADTASGGAGEDWVVGGKDNDVLSGGEAYDIVYGNLGSDTCDGGAGNDIVRGGQQDDLVIGGDGDDWVSGDRDNDTVTGGLGADIFHSFGDAGLDRVTDFNRSEGDRVLLDPGTTYTLAQVGLDTVITMNGAGQLVLVGVSMSSLTGGWITVG